MVGISSQVLVMGNFMCVCRNLTLHVVHKSQDLRHIWYCVSEYQTPLRGSFETVQVQQGVSQLNVSRIARHLSWDSRGIFCPLNVGFCEFSCQKQKNQHGGEGVQLFVGIWVQQGVSQLSVTRIARR